MSRLRKVLGLPAAGRRLLLAAYGLLWLAVLGLRTCRLRRTQGMAARAARLLLRLHGRARAAPGAPGLVGWAVEIAGRYVPGGTCLAQALAAQVLLASLGAASTVQVGVARDSEGGLDAHAWVQCLGVTVVGGESAVRYTPLLSLDLQCPRREQATRRGASDERA